MNITGFSLASSVFENVIGRRIEEKRVGRYEPIELLLTEIHDWYRFLRELDDSHARELSFVIWRLRLSVTLAISPYDDPSLELNSLLERATALSVYFPDLRDRADRLREFTDGLIVKNRNPKREILLQILSDSENSNVGLVSAVTRNVFPGLTEELFDELDKIAGNIEFVASKRTLLASKFDLLIVPFGTRLCSIAHEIYSGFRAAHTVVIAYSVESMAPVRELDLPCKISLDSSFDVFRPNRVVKPAETHATIETEIDPWQSIRVAESGVTDDPEIVDTEYLVPARAVLLSTGSYVCLRDDQKVIEVSDVVEGRLTLDDFGGKIPRKNVPDLCAGELIVLRIRGSGTELIEVADELLKKDGKSDLRARATAWKPILEQALRTRGTRWFYQKLNERGYEFSSPHGYLWKWTTDEVICPRSIEHFFETIAILDDLGLDLGEANVLESAETRWKELQELKRFHRRAGVLIRNELLKKLRSIIGTQPMILDMLELSLKGMKKGSMAIVRVASIDDEIVPIPYSRIGVVSSLTES